MILNLNLSTFPGKNANVLAFKEEHSFWERQLTAENFGLPFKQSEPNEILDFIYT